MDIFFNYLKILHSIARQFFRFYYFFENSIKSYISDEETDFKQKYNQESIKGKYIQQRIFLLYTCSDRQCSSHTNNNLQSV